MRPKPHSAQSEPRTQDVLGSLFRIGDVRRLSLAGLHLVMAMRLFALFERAGRDPLVELSQRFGSVSAALAMVDLADQIGQCWPERYQSSRPCCLSMTPDEWTVSQLCSAVEAGSRGRFVAALDGFVRRDRHDRLFDAAVRIVAALPQT